MLFLLLACAPKTETVVETVVAPQPAPPTPAFAVDLLSSMDTTVSACDDFYQYACGGWLKNTTLPADKPSWSRSFSTIQDSNREKLRGVLESAAAKPEEFASVEDARRAGSYYAACMDEPAAEAAGTTAMGPYIKQIDGIKDAAGFMKVAGGLQKVGVPALIEVFVDSDFKNPDNVILQLSQGGIALPDRSYYTPEDDAGRALLDGYRAHIAAMLVHTGMSKEEAEKESALVLELEKQIAAVQIPREDFNNPDNIYHLMDMAGLKKEAPGLDWAGYMTAMGAPTSGSINVMTPGVFTKVAPVISKTKVGTLRAYLRWHLIHSMPDAMTGAIYQEHFGFFGKQVLGIGKAEDRWKRCVRATDGALGEITGKLFVEKYFAGESRPTAAGMIKGIEGAFEASLPGLSWMDDATRQRAVEKARMVSNKIGYPDVWRDYSSLSMNAKDNAGNILAARGFEVARNLAKVGRPVDKSEWYMSAPMVNAYYNPTWNEIVFPAGILQHPFFSASNPAAMNYGGIGWVMGHELIHGFDDGGRKFDGSGKLTEWWAPEVAARYEERAGCVEQQYNKYEAQPGLFVNGKLTLGENIADIGGLKMAYKAFKSSGAPAANVPGLTDDQLFFVAAAQNWCSVSSPQWETMLVRSNPHSPGKFRVLGPMSDSADFHAAFGCAVGTPMRPAQVCEVW